MRVSRVQAAVHRTAVHRTGADTPGRRYGDRVTDVGIARVSDRGAAARTLADAFLDDPLMTWALPRSRGRERRLRRFFGGLQYMFAEMGVCDQTGDGRAVALWARPDQPYPSLRRQLGALPRVVSALGRRTPAMGSAQRTLAGAEPEQPIWHLLSIGVRRDAQGQGLGSALLEHRLRIADRAGISSYLESSNEANVGFYERRGFEVRTEIALAPGIRVWGMLRRPAS